MISTSGCLFSVVRCKMAHCSAKTEVKRVSNGAVSCVHHCTKDSGEAETDRE